MKKRQPCIYKITNLVDGKVYIGQTMRSFDERKRSHISGLRRGVHDNIHLQNAWNKYGEQKFRFEIIQLCEIKELDDLEVLWIELFNSTTRKYGYNLESGGSFKKILSKETRKKISTSTKRLNRTKGSHPLSKKVIRINDNVIFDSMREAEESIGASSGTVSQVCRGNSKVVIGNDGEFYQFAYYEETKKFKLKSINISKLNIPKKVICVNTKEVYESTQKASEKTGVSQSKISMACNKKRLSAGKDIEGRRLIWRFYDEYDENEIISISVNRVQSEKTKKKISIANKGRKVDIKVRRKISLALTKINKYIAINPKSYEIIDFDNREKVIEFLRNKGYNNPTIGNVQRCCERKRKTAYGLKWRYVE